MAVATIINKFGKMQGWNSITTNALGRDLEGIGKLSYDDNVDMDNVYGSGKFPVGRSEGNYAAKCTLGLFKEELDALQSQLPPGMRIQDLPPFDIIVEYELNGGQIKKDRINNFQFKNRGIDVKQSDGSIMTDCEGVVSHIDWGI